MPTLSASVNDRWHQARDLLKAGAATGYGETFTHASVAYRRTASRADLDSDRQGRPIVRAINLATGELIHISHQENQAFWQWAAIETLRLAGLRAEELVELTHLSVRHYQRSNGEVIALLVISPSTSDRERVIPMSAELFTSSRRSSAGISPRPPAPTSPEAVFDEDVVRHYQEFLDRRRAQRPAGEYRQPTPQEWNEFDTHFDRRRVELGSCGRPYGTGCTHEHACIRCPMLSIDPKMLPRLDELEQDLLARRERAIAENWLGEIDGLNLTLTFLRSKRRAARARDPDSPPANPLAAQEYR